MIRSALCSALLLALAASVQATSFTYRGQLEDGGLPAEGRFDLKLTLYADPSALQPLAMPIELNAVEVRHGGFAVGLDFADLSEHVYTGWLEVAVKTADDGAYWPLPERQQVALKAQICPESWALAGNASTSPAVNFLGTTDNQPLVLRTNNQTAFRLGPGATAPNVIGGHASNWISGGVQGTTIGGGGHASLPNRIFADFSTVGGGIDNLAAANTSTVGGGFANTASSTGSSVGGGAVNTASGTHSRVGGGTGNVASAAGSGVGGGQINSANGDNATIGGGEDNRANGFASTVAGGYQNTAQGYVSTIGGGHFNCAGGAYSWAGGQQAKVRPSVNPGSGPCAALTYPGGDGDKGTFVWADSQNTSFISTGTDQFLVRAGGGFAINTSMIGFADDLVIAARQGGDADADILMITRAGKAARIYLAESNGGLVFATEGSRYSFGGGIDSNRWINTGANGAHLTVGGAWTNGSSRAFKHTFESIDPLDMLARVIELPITRWSYREEGATRHVGPMAEDFAAVFEVGQDPRYISTVDASGVALAAIQGLNARIEAENANLRAELTRQAALLHRMQGTLDTLLRQRELEGDANR